MKCLRICIRVFHAVSTFRVHSTLFLVIHRMESDFISLLVLNGVGIDAAFMLSCCSISDGSTVSSVYVQFIIFLLLRLLLQCIRLNFT